MLDDRPIRARRVRVFERAIRWARHNPALATVATLLVATTVVSLALAARQ